MQRLVATRRLFDAPLDESPRHSLRQRGQFDAQPLGRDRPQAGVEIGNHAVEVDAKDKGTFGHGGKGYRMQDAGGRGRTMQPCIPHPQSSIYDSPRNFCSTSGGAGA